MRTGADWHQIAAKSIVRTNFSLIPKREQEDVEFYSYASPRKYTFAKFKKELFQ